MSAFKSNSGKIDASTFDEVLVPRCGFTRNEVRTGPRFGVDTSVIDLGSRLGMAVSSDPLSLIPTLGLQESAWLSVHLLVNDMATTGFSPMYAQFVLNLPPGLSRDTFEEYWEHIHRFCEEAGVAITGGHTGQAEGQNSTVSGGGTMFLTAPLHEIITSDGAEPGDCIIVTKESALTATSILAMSFPETVRNGCGEEIYRSACENFYRTSCLQDGLGAAELLQNNAELKAMHDVTEGGILGAAAEMAGASGCGFTIENSKIPSGEPQRRVAELFDIDHRLSVGAGSMIIAVKPGSEHVLINHLESLSVKATVVGHMKEKEQGYRIIENGEENVFNVDGADPYWAAFFKALNSGWT